MVYFADDAILLLPWFGKGSFLEKVKFQHDAKEAVVDWHKNVIGKWTQHIKRTLALKYNRFHGFARKRERRVE